MGWHDGDLENRISNHLTDVPRDRPHSLGNFNVLLGILDRGVFGINHMIASTMNKGSNSKRSRGRSNQKRNSSNKNQSFDGSGLGGRIRGNAHQVLEKYLALARDTSATDRIAAEGYYQYAEHYYRLLNVQSEAMAERQAGRNEQLLGRNPSSASNNGASNNGKPSSDFQPPKENVAAKEKKRERT